MVLNPCCCFTLRSWGFAIGILIFFTSLGGMVRDLKGLIFDHHTEQEGHSTPDLIIDVIWLLLHLFSIVLSVFLTIGAQKAQVLKCQIWLFGNVVCVVMGIVVIVLLAAASHSSDALPLLGTVIATTLLNIYFILVVYALIQELKKIPPENLPI